MIYFFIDCDVHCLVAYLSDLSTFMVSTYECDSVWVPYLQVHVQVHTSKLFIHVSHKQWLFSSYISCTCVYTYIKLVPNVNTHVHICTLQFLSKTL